MDASNARERDERLMRFLMTYAIIDYSTVQYSSYRQANKQLRTTVNMTFLPITMSAESVRR